MQKYLLTLLIGLCLLLGACENQETLVEHKSETKSNIPTYRVAVGPPFPPFSWRGENGKPIGFEIDLLNAIATHQGISLTFDFHPWEGIFDTLSSDKYDIVGASVTITEERAEKMAFSRPYFQSRQAALLSPAAGKIQRLDDLKNKPIAIQKGSTSDTLMTSLLGDNKNFFYQDSTYLCVASLLSSGKDAAVATVMDSGPAEYYAAQHRDKGFHALIDMTLPVESYGFALKKGRSDLARKLNNGLKQVLADGTYSKIYVKWFKHEPDADLIQTLQNAQN